MNILKQSVHTFGGTPRSGRAGSQSKEYVSFIRKCQIVLQSDCTTLQSDQQHMSFSRFPSLQHLSLSVFFNFAILVGVNQYLTVVLIFISQMTNDIVYLFTHLLVIWISSFLKGMFKYFAHLIF